MMDTKPDDLIDIEDEDGTVRTVIWPRCAVRGCPNRICLSKGSEFFCHPHMEGLELIKRMARACSGET